jgi:hypothetical protein
MTMPEKGSVRDHIFHVQREEALMVTTATGHAEHATMNRAVRGAQGAGMRREPIEVVDALDAHLAFADGLLEPLEQIGLMDFSDQAVISLTVQARARIRAARHLLARG